MAGKGPGKSQRKGISLMQLHEMFPDEEHARRWFESILWPDGPYCPHCGSMDVQCDIKHPTMTHRCRDCPNRRMFSLKTGTVMAKSPLSYRKWAMAVYLFATNLKGVSSLKLRRELEISQKSAWFLAHRMRETWRTFGGKFKGPAEVDETFMGGIRKNMSHRKRKEMKGAGRLKGKTIVAGAKDRETNQVSARVIKSTDANQLHLFIKERVEPTAQVYTDDHKGYLGVKNPHKTVNHSARQYVKGDVGTQGIESFWSMLKRAHMGIFHKISPKHMDRYIQEFTGRHNVRELDTIDQMRRMAEGMALRRLTYEDLTAWNGLDSGARTSAPRW